MFHIYTPTMSTPKVKNRCCSRLSGRRKSATESDLKKPLYTAGVEGMNNIKFRHLKTLRGGGHLQCWSTYMTECTTLIRNRSRQLRVEISGFSTAVQCCSSKHTHEHLWCLLQPQSCVDPEHNRTQHGHPNHKRNDKLVEAMLCKRKKQSADEHAFQGGSKMPGRERADG